MKAGRCNARMFPESLFLFLYLHDDFHFLQWIIHIFAGKGKCIK